MCRFLWSAGHTAGPQHVHQHLLPGRQPHLVRSLLLSGRPRPSRSSQDGQLPSAYDSKDRLLAARVRLTTFAGQTGPSLQSEVTEYGDDEKGRVTSRTTTQSTSGFVFRDNCFYTYDSKKPDRDRDHDLHQRPAPNHEFDAETAAPVPEQVHRGHYLTTLTRRRRRRRRGDRYRPRTIGLTGQPGRHRARRASTRQDARPPRRPF